VKFPSEKALAVLEVHGAKVDRESNSALLTTTMFIQKEVIATQESKGLRARTKDMIGGAPVMSDWVNKIGADCYSEDAIGVVSTANLLMVDALPESCRCIS
jgi:dimethylamine corrinoid protein